jgi:hypothetical protein
MEWNRGWCRLLRRLQTGWGMGRRERKKQKKASEKRK